MPWEATGHSAPWWPVAKSDACGAEAPFLKETGKGRDNSKKGNDTLREPLRGLILCGPPDLPRCPTSHSAQQLLSSPGH